MEQSDVRELIKFCQRSGVSSFSFKDLKVEFFDRSQAKRLIKNTKKEIINEEVERLLIEDPLAHEELIQKTLLEGGNL